MTTFQQRHDGRPDQAPVCKTVQAGSIPARVSNTQVAQLAERRIVTPRVGRSNRPLGAIFTNQLPAVAERSMRRIETPEITVRVRAAGPHNFTTEGRKAGVLMSLENSDGPVNNRPWGFDPLTLRQFHNASGSSTVEQRIPNPKVVGSIPTRRAKRPPHGNTRVVSPAATKAPVVAQPHVGATTFRMTARPVRGAGANRRPSRRGAIWFDSRVIRHSRIAAFKGRCRDSRWVHRITIVILVIRASVLSEELRRSPFTSFFVEDLADVTFSGFVDHSFFNASAVATVERRQTVTLEHQTRSGFESLLTHQLRLRLISTLRYA